MNTRFSNVIPELNYNLINTGVSLVDKQNHYIKSKIPLFFCKKGDEIIIIERSLYNHKEGHFYIVKKKNGKESFMLDQTELKEDEILNPDFELC